MLQKSTDVSVVSEVFEAWTAFRRGLQKKILKRKRPNSKGSSSASSSRSPKRRAIQKPSSDPSSAASCAMDSNNSTPSSTARLGLLSTGSSSGSPKIKKRDQVKRVFRKFQRKRSSDSTSSGGGSDTSIEGDSPRRIRTSFVPEVTITPSSDSSTAASPTASVRTIFRVNPHTGKPATQYDLGHLVPPPAANSRRRQRKRTETSQAFPKRSSSLRASLDFPFNPEKAVEQHDESHLYHTNSSGLNMGTGTLPSERPESLVTPSLKSAKSTISKYSLDKPLPALPKDKRSSVLDFYSKKMSETLATPSEALDTPTKPSRTPASNECLIGFSTESNNGEDDTQRPLAWPLPTEHQSIYGSGGITTQSPPNAASAIGIDDDNDIDEDEDNNNDAADAASTPRPHCRANSGSSELSKYGFQFYKPLDPRVIDARLRQYHRAHSPPLTPNPSPSKTVITPDDFPTPPSSSPPSRKPNTFGGMPCFTALPALHNRNSVMSVLSTADSFVTATEEVGGEESGAEGAAEDADPFAELGTDDAFVDAGLRLAFCAGDDDEDKCDPFEDSGIAMNKSDDEVGEDEGEDVDDSASSASSEFEMRTPTAEDCNNLPFRVTTSGPPTLSTELHEDLLAFEYDPIKNFWDPLWKTEPDVGTIKNLIRPYVGLCCLSNEDVKVEFLAKGAWNKVYTVSAVDEVSGITSECVFRCALPGLPWFRMQLEVSTMEYVRMNTTIPVPKVFAFDSSMENPLGMEWLLMEKVNGTSYIDAQSSMTFDAKVELHKTVADWVHQLSQLSFDKMGSIYRRWDLPITDKDAFVVGPMNDWEFTADIRLDLDFYRGPFTSKEHYFNSLIGMRIAEAADPRLKERADYFAARQSAAGDTPEDPDIEFSGNDRYNHEALRKAPKYGIGLQSLLPFVCGNEKFTEGSIYLYHDDIHARNIMVDATGKPVALLDWEGAYACPHDWTSRYPGIVDPDDYEEPEPFDIIGPMDEMRAMEEAAWERFRLRNVYDERLKELDSPVLRDREVNEVLDEIKNRVESLEWCHSDWDFIDDVKEKEVKALLGVS